MVHTLTPDDVSKSVIDANGDHIGTVCDVVDGQALVEPEPEVPETVAMAFGWRGDPDSYPLPTASIESVTESGIYLRSSL